MENHYCRYKLLLSLILVFFVSIFCYINTVFGATDFDNNMYYPEGVPVNYTSTDAGRYATNKVLLYDENSSKYYILIYFSNENEATHQNQKLYLRESDNFILGSGCDHYQIQLFENGKWKYIDWTPYYDINNNKTTNLTKIVSKCKIISTSSNIYTDSSCNNIFFQPTPLVEITTITQVEELPKIITKVMKVIIPIGLVILLIGLLIYVIKSVISRAA